jgi:hypothetical protein
VIEPGPTFLPELTAPAPPAPGYGRLRLEESDPTRVEFVARAIDFLRLSRYEVARRVNAHSEGRPERSATEQTKRDHLAGQRRLRERGVLPWAAFEGPVPAGWWRDERFIAAIELWRREAVTSGSPRPPTLLQRVAADLQAAAGDHMRKLVPMPPAAIRQARLAEIESNPWRPPADLDSEQ